jgi:DnaJ homolog subfamily C member 19
MKLLWLAAIAVVAWRMLTGRWPWENRAPARRSASAEARALLGVAPGAGREEIVAAHRALIARVHPDRGGSGEAVHEANAARDVLLAEAAWEADHR